MTSSTLIQPHHLGRRAAIYIRQSTGHQVMTNTESRLLQETMRDHVRRLGWTDERIDVVDADTGRSGASTAGRDAYKDLLSEVALGQVGVVISYDSARLSRNCSDWYPLLDVCALKGCLVADRDGVYDPASVNGRLLLGMKGILSEVELHTLRGRLDAGLINKARRGELVKGLPVGLVWEEGRVVKVADVQVQETIELVFQTFLERRSASKVVRYFRDSSLRIPAIWRNSEIVWSPPTHARIIRILKNPAYAGAYVYGRKRWVRTPGEDGRRPPKYRTMEEWPVLLHDRFPSYIDWETFEKIQAILADNHAKYQERMTRGIPRAGSTLLQGICYCGECGRKMMIGYGRSAWYACRSRANSTGQPSCQSAPAPPIDEAVAGAFFEALAPAELDLYEDAMRARQSSHEAVDAAQERELRRLRYEADLARRRYDRVDPDNRNVAGELERRWEAALTALREAEHRFAELRKERDRVVPLTVPRDLRSAFSALGESMPGLWESEILTHANKKALLRCLVDKVVLRRTAEHWDNVRIRIIWKGGAASELDVGVPVDSAKDLSSAAELEEAIMELARKGVRDEDAARILSERGFRSAARTSGVAVSWIATIRARHGHQHLHPEREPRHVDGYLTVRETCAALDLKESWLYQAIRRKRVEIERDPATGLYLFPDHADVLEALRQLRNLDIRHVKIESTDQERGHQDA